MRRGQVSFAPLACVWGLAMLVSADPSRANEACAGAISGTVLGPLPTPLQIQLDTPVDDTANPALAHRLMAGLQRAGVTVTSDGSGNARLSLAISVTPPPGGGAGPVAGSYRNMGWASGDAAPANWNIVGTKLTLSAEVTNSAAAALAWLGTLECTVTTSDPGLLSESLGVVIGRSVGRASGRERF